MSMIPAGEGRATKRMARNHVGLEAVIVEGTLDGKVGHRHGRLVYSVRFSFASAS